MHESQVSTSSFDYDFRPAPQKRCPLNSTESRSEAILLRDRRGVRRTDWAFSKENRKKIKIKKRGEKRYYTQSLEYIWFETEKKYVQSAKSEQSYSEFIQ